MGGNQSQDANFKVNVTPTDDNNTSKNSNSASSSSSSPSTTTNNNSSNTNSRIAELHTNAGITPTNGGKCPHKSGGGGWSLFGRSFTPQNDTTTTNSSSGGECPVQSPTTTTTTTTTTNPQQQMQEFPSECPMRDSSGSSNGGKKGGVMYNVYSQPLDPTNNMPVVANQLPSPGQTEALSTERVSSNIPKGGATTNETWTYPSPQMFYNSLARKSKLGSTTEAEISSVVSIHNNMNEKTWAKVLQWESVLSPPPPPSPSPSKTSDEGPKLLKFMGRPSDLSPKAYLKNLLFSHPLPFDRHDWTVQRPDGTSITYVIDYYHDESAAEETEESAHPSLQDFDAVKSILVDVRPAVVDVEKTVREKGVWDGLLVGGLWEVVLGRGWTMPLARWRDNRVFEPLGLMPTRELRGQVEESEKVWEGIQKNVRESKEKSMVLDGDGRLVEGGGGGEEVRRRVTDEEAREVAKNFAAVLKECADARREMEEAVDEAEYSKKSLGLSMCMAKIVCPLQQNVFVDAITALGDDEGDSEEDERVKNARVDAAMENMLLCVQEKDRDVAEVKQSHPKLFGLWDGKLD